MTISSPGIKLKLEGDLANVSFCKQDIDRTLLRENLKLSHAERLLNLMQLQRLAQVLRHAGHRARRARI